MLVPITTLKSMLGLPATPDPQIDPVLTTSSTLAQALVEARLGRKLEGGAPVSFSMKYASGVRAIRLDEFPIVSVGSVSIDGATIPTEQYEVNFKLGMVVLRDQRREVRDLSVAYTPGFTPETLAQDLQMVLSNIAIQIYENGGKIAMPSATTGELKSVTIFDAMSMSFDTNGSSTASGAPLTGPAALLEPWSFVLDRYSAEQYALGRG